VGDGGTVVEQCLGMRTLSGAWLQCGRHGALGRALGSFWPVGRAESALALPWASSNRGGLGPGPNGAGLHCACGLARLTISIAFPDKQRIF
jgi:hypothetical protein